MTRKEAIKIMEHLKSIVSSEDYIEALNMAIEALKEPERKHGQWIKYGYKWKCSECDKKISIDGTPEENGLYYCPNCGANMRGKSK